MGPVFLRKVHRLLKDDGVFYIQSAGFEIQAVHNMGVSYGRTLNAWRLVWEEKKDEIVKVYGERSWRRWHVFASWCTDVARRGGSTVNFITVTKAGAFKARTDAQARLAPGAWTPGPLGKLLPREGDGSAIVSEQVIAAPFKDDYPTPNL